MMLDRRAATVACLFCGERVSAEATACPHCGCVRFAARGRPAVFVGREREIAFLREAVERTVGGRGGLISISGPAGIGKTRLVEEALEFAKARGCFDLMLRGFEPNAALPYWTLVDALQQDALAAPDSPAAEAVLTLLDALRGARDQSVEATTGFEARTAGTDGRVYETLTAVLRGLTARRALIVICDDVQWFDPPTLNLIRYTVRLARSLPILLICSYRGEAPPAGFLPVSDEATREGLLNELRLEPLSPVACRRLAQTFAPAALSDHTTDELLRLAEGNPFYLTQLVQTFAGVAVAGNRVLIPQSLRGLTEQRLTALAPAARSLVQTVAVLGRDCSLELLAALTPIPVQELAAALDEALSAGVLVERDTSGRPRYDISHALLREAAVQHLNALARVQIQLRIAEALHQRRQLGEPAPAAAIASHYLEARPLASVERVLAYVEEAAEEAIAGGAPEEAARFLAAALELHQQQGAPAEVSRALRLRLLDAHGRAGDTEAAEREGAAALTELAAPADAPARAQVYALLAEHRSPRLRPRDVIAAADAGLASLGAERSALAARLRYLRAHAQHMLDDSSELLPTALWLEEERLAAVEPAAPVWARLLRVLWCVWHEPAADQALTLCRAAIAHTRALGDRRAEAMTHLWLADVLNHDARPREALAAIDTARQLARETGSSALLVDAGSSRTESLLQMARWEELEETVEETLPILLRLRSTYFAYHLVASHAWSRRLRGLPWTLPPGLAFSFGDSQMFLAASRANLARQIVEADAVDERTHGLINGLTTLVPVAGAGIAWATSAMPLLAVLTLTGRRDDVAARYDPLLPFARFSQYATFGALELGRAATLLRRWDEAEARLEEAQRLAQTDGLALAGARTLLALGDYYRQRGRRGDRARADEALQQAVERCQALGLGPDAARARALLDRLGPVAAATLPAGLTAREAQVLRLLASGRTNRQIAEDLTISEKTVEQHLLNLYQKLQVDSRAKATAFAYEHGLIERGS